MSQWKKGYLVAGKSGHDMIKFLEIVSDESFGEYVKNNYGSKI